MKLEKICSFTTIRTVDIDNLVVTLKKKVKLEKLIQSLYNRSRNTVHLKVVSRILR